MKGGMSPFMVSASVVGTSWGLILIAMHHQDRDDDRKPGVKSA
jgi:hypothetical protein